MAPYLVLPLPPLPKEEWKSVPWAAIGAHLQAMVTGLTDELDGSDVRGAKKEVEKKAWHPMVVALGNEHALEEKSALDNYIHSIRDVVASLQSASDKCNEGIVEQLVIALERPLTVLKSITETHKLFEKWPYWDSPSALLYPLNEYVGHTRSAVEHCIDLLRGVQQAGMALGTLGENGQSRAHSSVNSQNESMHREVARATYLGGPAANSRDSTAVKDEPADELQDQWIAAGKASADTHQPLPHEAAFTQQS